jgi:hypothetical protein
LFGPWSLLTDLAYWHRLADRLAFLLLPPLLVGLVFSAAAIRADRFWWSWSAGSLVSLFVFTTLNNEHFYYQLPFVPALAALAAYGAPRLPASRVLQVAGAALLVGVSLAGVSDLWKQNPTYYGAGTAVAARTAPGATVIAMSSYGSNPYLPMILYYADRAGWNLPPETDSEGLDLPNACDLVVVNDGGVPLRVPTGWTATEQTDEYILARRNRC